MKILNKEILSAGSDMRVVKMDVLAPEIASQAMPGQFVVVMVSEPGERIPLTIVNSDAEKGVITLIFQEAGLTTRLLGRMDAGRSLYALVGPLGHPTEIKNYGRVIVVGGGVGIAEIYPVTKALKTAANHVTTILGARTKGLLILEKELESVSDEFHVTTDDGSCGRKGFVTDVLKGLLNPTPSPAPCPLSPVPCHLVYAVGPIPMMKRVSEVTRPFNVNTLVSLNALMVDATGMCGCCRVTVGGRTRFSCVDGPEFDAHAVDWDELAKRNRIYEGEEKHICSLNKL